MTPPLPPTFSTTTFVYDGDGKRVKSIMSNTGITYFVGAHYEVNDGRVTKYYYAGSQRIALRASGHLSFLLGDHLGSTSLTTDANGLVASEMRYKAWGEVRYASGLTPTQYQFTGQYSYANDFGLLFFNARWVDPSLGRFAQADTIIPSVGNSIAWDRYAYADNAPLKYIDPSGHCTVSGYWMSDDSSACQWTASNTPVIGDLAENDIKILTVIIALESSSGKVPDNVNYMKTWSLLNLHSYHQAYNKGYTPFESWKHHERPLFDELGISGTINNQTNALLQKYKMYSNGDSQSISAERFAQIELSVISAAKDWAQNGSNSSADPVHGAVGFTDASGLFYPSGSNKDRHLSEIPNYQSAITTNAAEMESFRQRAYSNSSPIYQYSTDPYTGKPTYTFTWFEPPSYPWP